MRLYNKMQKSLIFILVMAASIVAIYGLAYVYADTTVMNDTVQGVGLVVFPTHYTPIGEYASSTSSLVGQPFNNMTIVMKKVGSPAGNVTIGVFNSDKSVKKFIANFSSSSIATTYKSYSFQLPAGQTYTIASGDRIGLAFPAGNSSNYIAVMTDNTNTFDGTNSYLSYFTTSWQPITGSDITMTLRNVTSSSNHIITIIPPANILSVTTNSSRNISNLGNYTVMDKNDANPTVTNNSTGVFGIGLTRVLWNLHDHNGQVASAIQNVTVVSAPAPTDVNNRVIMINFDDSTRSSYLNGLPILDKYAIKATWFVICGFVGGSNTYYMNWTMVHGLSSDGQDVQVHTMTHRDPNHLSQADLDYEYGQGKRCLINNGTSNVHMAASPLGTGDNNMTVVQTWERYFDMVRSGHNSYARVTCNNAGVFDITYCAPYNMTSGNLKTWHRYSIPYHAHDSVLTADNYNDTKVFQDFISEVNSIHDNTNSTTIDLPIILYHNVAKLNTGTSYTSAGAYYTSSILLDAEFKYLKDNGWKFYNFKNVSYDANKNIFHIQ